MATRTIEKKKKIPARTAAARKFATRWATLKASIDQSMEGFDSQNIDEEQILNAQTAHASLVAFAKENRIRDPVVYFEINGIPDPNGSYGFIRTSHYAFTPEFVESAQFKFTSLMSIIKKKKSVQQRCEDCRASIARWAKKNVENSLIAVKSNSIKPVDANRYRIVERCVFEYYD